jgi:hypothetical protein
MQRTIVLRRIALSYSQDIPKNTPRIKLDDGSHLIYRQSTVRPERETEDDLPPLVHAPKKPTDRIYLSPSEIIQARALRNSDPDRWTAGKLAKRFSCTNETIQMYAPAPKIRKEAVQDEKNRFFDNASWIKKVRLINRMRRRALW